MSSTPPTTPSSDPVKKRPGILDMVETAGNKLPDPAILFLLGALVVMLASGLASWMDWEVVKKVPVQVVDEATGKSRLDLVPSMVTVETVNEAGETVVRQTEEVLRPVNLLTSDGIFWVISSMIDNFMRFPPLGIVLVGMLGIGVAERTGMIAALLKLFMLITPTSMLTPAMVFIGVMSSLAADAGYVVLPPLAALLFRAVGRSPMVGIAAVFAGVSAGFNANLLVTGMDPLLAGLSTSGAQFVDPTYVVNPSANWLFMIFSTFMATLVGWGVTHWIVEPRFETKRPEEGGPIAMAEGEPATQSLSSDEVRGVKIAALVATASLALVMVNILVPGFPLHGKGTNFDRWAESIVPLMFLLFLLPGIAYGIANQKIQSTKDLSRLMTESMAAMAPIIVLAFFAAQFVEYFRHSNLGAMLAVAGGEFLATAGLPTFVLLLAFILLTAVFNMFVGSMSAKYALFAPIFIPMLMLVGISPELAQAAYRIGDSVTNIITPLNPYLIIILVFMQKHDRSAGMGTLIATMLPYTIFLTIGWSLMLGAWLLLELPLGIPFDTGPLTYPPSP
jgi:aminobenzoyl-glutamate transport protein